MNDLLVKYNALPLKGQKEVDDFLDFMLRRHQGKENFDMKSSMTKIVTHWDDYNCDLPVGQAGIP